MLDYIDMGEGETLVLICGLGQRKEAWKNQYKLSKYYRLIIPELRSDGEITIKNYAKDVIELLEHLNIESAHIAGLSLGGIIAQELYRQKPNLVRSLILANTTSYIPYFLGNWIVSNYKTDLINGTILDKIANRGLYDKSYIKEAKKTFHIKDTYIEAARSAVGLNYFPYLYCIDKPVLLIGSTHDEVTPVFNVSLMSMCIRNCETVVFEDCGHLSNIEQKDQFNKAVLDFIKNN
ncbi:alpha/beta hydrolase [Bacillus xiapuensis]|uniref:Alpha/beta hydrolase n=1 Tax=Bacillus xiapuensis TaxID=2014075 RepID=A0ABU6NAQ7_9BACI|nr:alpha/beta hydrolase [Bacillus xiapuensis]